MNRPLITPSPSVQVRSRVLAIVLLGCALLPQMVQAQSSEPFVDTLLRQRSPASSTEALATHSAAAPIAVDAEAAFVLCCLRAPQLPAAASPSAQLTGDPLLDGRDSDFRVVLRALLR